MNPRGRAPWYDGIFRQQQNSEVATPVGSTTTPVDPYREELLSISGVLDKLHGGIHDTNSLLRRIVEILSIDAREKDIVAPMVIPQTPGFVRLDYQGRSHALLFLIAATTITFNTFGQLYTASNIPPGWNIIDLPDGTVFFVSSPTTATNAIIRYTDTAYGNPI